MLTIIAFLLTLLGSINWLLIGLLQYDFVAGIFGYQGSVFSRLIYIIIGASCVVLIIKTIKSKGSLPVFSRRNKKDLSKQIDKVGQKQAIANVEASSEDEINDHFGHREKELQFDENNDQSFFDENIK